MLRHELAALISQYEIASENAAADSNGFIEADKALDSALGLQNSPGQLVYFNYKWYAASTDGGGVQVFDSVLNLD